MPTPLKVGGYVDRQELNRAMQANSAARRVLGRILEERPGTSQLVLLLAEIGQHLANEYEALVEMERIRRRGAEVE